jgi:hypothetical protein
MTNLRRNIKFIIENKNNCFERTIEFFAQSGFRLVKKSEQNLLFTRGSFALNMVTFNPLKWKSAINININDQELNAVFDINATGQIITLKEENLWDSFIDSFRLYMIEGIDFKKENARAIKATKKDSLKYVGWALIGAIIGGIPGGILAYLTGNSTIVSVGAVAGAMALLTKKIKEGRGE